MDTNELKHLVPFVKLALIHMHLHTVAKFSLGELLSAFTPIQ